MTVTAALGRGGGKSPSSGESGSGSGTGTGLRRQQSLTERERPRRDRASVHEGKLLGSVVCCFPGGLNKVNISNTVLTNLNNIRKFDNLGIACSGVKFYTS